MSWAAPVTSNRSSRVHRTSCGGEATSPIVTCRVASCFRITAGTGSVITKYQYDFNDDLWQDFSPALTATGSRTISGLAFETAKTLRVRAVNANGNGPASAGHDR